MLIAIAAFSSVNAQCYVGTYAVPAGPNVNFYVFLDSALTQNLTSYYWDFGDGDTAHAFNTQHTYAASGTYNFCFHAVSPGCTTDTCYDVTVDVCGGGTHFNTSQTGLGEYYFRELDSLGTFAWDLGDGTTSNQHYFSHTYAASGTYLVCLTRNYNGCTTTKCDTLVVDLCGFTPAVWYTNLENDSVQFYSVAGSGQASTSAWTFTGGTPSTSSLQNPLVTFPDTGSYSYCVTIVSAGCTKNICNHVQVTPPPVVPCNAYFYYYTQASLANFYAADSIPNRIFAWNFGDGATASTRNPQHIYAQAGTYTVCLVTHAANGSCSDSLCRQVTVGAPPCLSYISHSDLGFGDINFNAYLDSFNTGGTYTWDFGDGSSGTTGQYPTHTYTTSGTYTACVTLSNSVCAGTLCDTVLVDVCYPGGGIDYSVNGYDVILSMRDHVGATYSWMVPNATPATSSGPATTVSFPTFGTYPACVAVTSPTGCSDTICINVVVPNPCHAQISYNQNTATSFSFYSYPIDSINPASFNYAWSFGDGANAAIANPVHNFAGNGFYTVCLTVTGNACADTTCISLHVAPLPPPNYYLMGAVRANGVGACSGTVYLISDSSGFLSVVNTITLVDSFGNGNCTGGYAFWAPQGTYYVKAALDVTDPNYANYLPTYYGNQLNWADATPITLNNHLTNGDIDLIAGVNPGGPGFVGGWVTQGAGLAIGGNNESRSTGDPLPNIQVNLLTLNDVPVAATFTDANGRYTFSNLALGTYKVYAEQINKVPYPLNVTLSANNPTQDNVNVLVNSNSAVTGLDDLRDIQIEGLYPNPVSDRATLSVSLKQNSKVKMTLTDVNGRLLQNKVLDLSTGANRITLDLSEEAAGIYHLSLTNETSKKIIKISKVK